MVKHVPKTFHSFFLLIFFSWTLFGQSYDLRPKFITGIRTTFTETQTVSVSSDFFPGSAQKYVIRSVYLQEVEKLGDNGDVHLIVTVKESGVQGKHMPPQRMDYEKLVGFPIKIQLDEQLRVKKIVPPENLPAESQTDFSRFKQFYYNLAPESQIPDHSVALGESWENEQTFSYEFMTAVFDQVQKLRSTLIKETDFQGKPSLEIKFDGEFNGTITEGMDGLINGSFKGKRVVEKETGQDLHLEMAIDQTMEQITERGDLTFQIQVSLERQLTHEESVTIQ